MRKILFATLALACISCTPQAYTMLVEKKVPGETGVDLDGKSICIVYVQDEEKCDTAFSSNFSDGLAQGIENLYFNGEKAVEVFSVMKEKGADYSVRDSLASMILETDADVIMLVDTPVTSQFTSAKDKYTAKVYVYDSMDKKDEVVPVTAVTAVTKPDTNPATHASDSQFMGFNVGSKFTVDWVAEQYTLLYYQSVEQKWLDAMDAAYSGKFNEAVDLWMTLADDPKNSLKSSCASYNIAVACHLTGNDELALEWLKRSDEEYPISLSSGLRKKIEAAR